MSDELPHRRSAELLKARWDTACNRYFITFCTDSRRPLLTNPAMAEALMKELSMMTAEGIVTRSSFVVMPDHLHWLFRKTEKRRLGQMVGRIKAKTGRALKECGGTWQRNYFEHRLRPDNPMEPYEQYMYMNPDRARLISTDTVWPYWRNESGLRFEFEQMLTDSGCPPKAWIEEIKRPFSKDPTPGNVSR